MWGDPPGSILLFGRSKYLRGLEIAELKEEDIPMV